MLSLSFSLSISFFLTRAYQEKGGFGGTNISLKSSTLDCYEVDFAVFGSFVIQEQFFFFFFEILMVSEYGWCFTIFVFLFVDDALAFEL